MKKAVFLLVVVCVFSVPAEGAYCSASSTNTNFERISNVQVGTINNTSGSDGYADYTAISTEMEIGTGYSMTVTDADPYTDDQCGIWVDWNQDEDFDDADETISVAGGPATFTATITPPAGAALGSTRMRIRIMWTGTVSPCGTASYGEVEDYTIIVTAVPTGLTISGYVKTEMGAGIENVSILPSSGESDITDANGYYELTFTDPWTGNILPIKSGLVFDPIIKEYSNLTTDLTNQDFIASPESSYGGGLGTAGSPFWISTAEHLQAIGTNPFHWDKHFRLMANINLSGYTDEQFNMIGFFSWVGFSFPFTGVFDGNGYTIRNFNYAYGSTKHEFIGIFSYISHPDAEVKNLTILYPNVNGGEHSVAQGALVGLLWHGTISNCQVQDGTVVGNHHSTGGLVGDVWGGTITECQCSADVSSQSGSAGGLVGHISDGNVSNCSAKGNVTGELGAGGLVGDNFGDISSCHSSSNVSGDQYVGGLVGENHALVLQSYSNGSVGVRSGLQQEIGGLVGRNISGGEISNCYSHTSVTGGSITAGLVGVNWNAAISNCYSTGSVSGTSSLGGLVAWQIDGGTTTNSFWDTEASNIYASAAGTGKTTAQMQDPNTFISAGWDFVGETANGTDDIWKLFALGIYPKLAWEKYSAGTGTFNNPYLIYSPEEMQSIGANPDDWDKHFKLMADIDMSGYTGTEYNLIGYYEGLHDPDNKPFKGTFDGNRHTISNFSYTSGGTGVVGLFSYVYGFEAGIRDLNLTGVNIDVGSGDYVGSLVGRMEHGVISNCYATGNVTGDRYVGGLAGYVWWTVICNCCATGTVTGVDEVGGLIGFSYIGRPSNCYATASVTGQTEVGGLIGSTSFTNTSTCYAAGSVSGNSEVGGLVGYDANGLYSPCFWDSTVNPTLSGIGNRAEPNVIGESTSNMQTQTTFTNAGWDFVGEMANGPDDDWGMPGGGGYPVLWWQLESLPVLPPLFSGGSGEPNDPYLISTAAELNTIGHNPKLMDKHFKLTNDINLGSIDFFMIGGHTCPFSGAFDGDGYLISDFALNAYEGWLGLFGIVGSAGRIENIDLVRLNVGSEHVLCHSIGGMAAANSGTISNCSVTGSVSAYFIVGALAAMNFGTISDCRAEADVSGTNLAGSLAGYNYGTIINSSAMGTVTGEYSIGGMVGINMNGVIAASRATGDVSAIRWVGGLAGENQGTIVNSYATGNVSADSYVGGLVGINFGFYYGAHVSNCYAAGRVSEVQRAGGLAGYNILGTFNKCFWDSTVNPSLEGIGDMTDPNVIGESTTNMQTKSTYTDVGWDFVGETANGTDDIWDICDGTNYPKLVSQIPMLGDFGCPDGVDMSDLEVLCEQWLFEELSADVWPDGGDGVVDFLDWAIFADAWQGTNGMDELAAFARQWLKTGPKYYIADIAPRGGDGVVNMLDYCALAENWLTGF